LRDGHVVAIAGVDGFPGVAAGVGCRKPEGLQEPVLAVGAVVSEGLAGPFAGDEDAAAGVAEVFAAVGFAFAGARAHMRLGVLGLDAVAEPVGAGRRAGFVAERVGEPVGVAHLVVGLRGVAVSDVLGEVLGQVADAAACVLRPGQDALRVEAVSEPGYMRRFGVRADRIERFVPGRQDFTRVGVEVGGVAFVPGGQVGGVEAHGVGGGHQTWW